LKPTRQISYANNNEEQGTQELSHNMTSSQPFLEVIQTPEAGRLPDLLDNEEAIPENTFLST